MGRTLEQILADEKPEVVANAQALAEEMLLNIHLAELREKVQKTHVEMAQALNIKQPTVTVMEKRGAILSCQRSSITSKRLGSNCVLVSNCRTARITNLWCNRQQVRSEIL